MNQFELTSHSPMGTSLKNYFCASYKELEELLGKPNSEGDQCKVSTEWVFKETDTGEIVTLYDYKETNLYSREMPSVEEFRSRNQYDWHIGAKEERTAKEFIRWLETYFTTK